jgi:uncharacterized membrane-anchored protein
MFETSSTQTVRVSRLGSLVDWFKTQERAWLLIGAAAQIVVLLGMIGMRTIPFLRGETVLLRVQPVDPRDLFRGDYVILGYDFSRLPANAIPGLVPQKGNGSERVEGQTVYVSLVPEADGQHYRGGSYSLTPPASGLFLRGTLGRWNRIDFGIDRYYVQEGTGHRYEEALRNRRLFAEVVVTADGQAAVKGLKIE